MRRPALAAACAVLGGAAAYVATDAPSARALTTGEVIGTYALKLKGDGWGATAEGTSSQPGGVPRFERIQGTAWLDIRPRDADVNDGLVRLSIALDNRLQRGLLGDATGGTKPAFSGVAALVGDAVSVIDSGSSQIFVGALTLRFDRTGRKVTGNWLTATPATGPDLPLGAAYGAHVQITGKRAQGVANPHGR